MKYRLLSLLFLVCTIIPSMAGESWLVEDFEHGLGPDWRVTVFKGETDYRIATLSSYLAGPKENLSPAKCCVAQTAAYA